MSLSTNSWDIVYTSKLGSVNNALTSSFKCNEPNPIKMGSYAVNFSKFQVAILADTIDTELKLTITLEGNYAAESTKKLSEPLASNSTITIHISLPLFNEGNYNAYGFFIGDIIGTGTFLLVKNQEGVETNSFLTEIVTYFKKNKTFHDYFSNLAIFSGHDWIKIGVLRIHIASNGYLLNDDGTPETDANKQYISFCYMLSRMEDGKEKATNYNNAYVDFNAIPDGATSALVIDRSVFAEHMVVPNIAKDVIVDFKNSGETEREKRKASFTKESAYSFVNNKDCKMRYADFTTSLTYIGFLPFIDALSAFFGYPVYHGTAFSGKANITVNEDHIHVLVKDVKYMYSMENYPKITQEYIAKLDKNVVDNKAKFSVKLIDKSFNYFHKDFVAEAWHIFGTSYWTRDKESNDSSRRAFVFDYLPSTSKLFKDLAFKIKDAIGLQMAVLRKKSDEVQKNPELSDLKKKKQKIKIERELQKNDEFNKSISFICNEEGEEEEKNQSYSDDDLSKWKCVNSGTRYGINKLYTSTTRVKMEDLNKEREIIKTPRGSTEMQLVSKEEEVLLKN
jgi:hypothetical protein